MRIGVVLHLLGTLLLFQAAFMALSALWSLVYGEDPEPLLLGALLTATVAYMLRYFTGPVPELNHREGFAVAALGWLGAATFGSLPLYLAGVVPTFADAWFETMSGFTTTGATLLEDISAVPRGLLFWRSLTQWLGGMGILVLSMAVLPRLGLGGAQLFKAEIPGPTPDRLLPRIAATARALWLVYIVLTLSLAALLLLGGVSLFESLSHTFTAMSTGGFSTRDLSVAGFDSIYMEIVLVLFMFLAGVNFALHYQVLHGKPSSLWQNPEFRFFLALTGLSIVLITINLYQYYSDILSALRYGSFQVVSIVTTTGYTTADFELWPSFSRALLLLLMFCGGCAGSTAGAIKQVRVLVMMKYGYRELFRLLHPRAIMPLRVGRQVLPEPVVTGILGFMVLYLAIFVISVLLLCSFQIDLITSFAAVAAILGNIGPGLGTVGPVENYAHFPQTVKIILGFLMLLGRLEIYTVLVLVIPDYLRHTRVFRPGHQPDNR